MLLSDCGFEKIDVWEGLAVVVVVVSSPWSLCSSMIVLLSGSDWFDIFDGVVVVVVVVVGSIERILRCTMFT